jgi:hypothetical protein
MNNRFSLSFRVFLDHDIFYRDWNSVTTQHRRNEKVPCRMTWVLFLWKRNAATKEWFWRITTSVEVNENLFEGEGTRMTFLINSSGKWGGRTKQGKKIWLEAQIKKKDIDYDNILRFHRPGDNHDNWLCDCIWEKKLQFQGSQIKEIVSQPKIQISARCDFNFIFLRRIRETIW